MPFDFLRRKKGAQPDSSEQGATAGQSAPGAATGRAGKAAGAPAGGAAPGGGAAPAAGAGGAGGRGAGGASVRFDGLTEDWRLNGVMHIDGRMSDALNRRETIAISEMEWAPIDGSGSMEPAPGLKSIDPYDLIAVLAGPDTLPDFTDEERAARRVRKEPYEVVLEAPPFRIRGTVHVFPGSDPQQMLDQAPEMFVPLTGAVAYVDDRPVADRGIEVVLVNRLYVRGVEETGR